MTNMQMTSQSAYEPKFTRCITPTRAVRRLIQALCVGSLNTMFLAPLQPLMHMCYEEIVVQPRRQTAVPIKLGVDRAWMVLGSWLVPAVQGRLRHAVAFRRNE